MTTIAACAVEGVMCSDSQWTDGSECGPMRKVWRIKGALYGLAGTWADINRWRDDLDHGRNSKALCTVLRLSDVGLLTWDSVNGWVDVGKQFAIGSGGKVARGALAAGAGCRRAVVIACSIDAGSGGAVKTYRLSKPR